MALSASTGSTRSTCLIRTERSEESGVTPRVSGRPKRLAPRSVKNTLVILREALQQARRERRIPRNPCTDVEPPTINAKQEPQWTAAQAKQFLALLDGERYRALFILTAATGLRRGELLG